MLVRTMIVAMVLSAVSFAQDDKAKAEVEKKIASAKKDVGKEYVDLGRWAADKKAHQLACPCWEKAIQYDPDNATARQKLGYKKDGDQWTQIPRFDVLRGYEGPADKKEAIETEFTARHAKADKKLGEEFYQAGKLAKDKGMAAQGEDCLHEALLFDTDHAAARQALGYTKENGVWVSQRDKDAQKGNAQKVAAASEGEEWKEDTDIEKTLGFKLSKRKSDRFHIWAFYGGEDLKKTMKLAEAAQAEFYSLFDLAAGDTVVPPPIELIILETQQQHEAFIDRLSAYPDADKKFAKTLGGCYSWQPPRGECWCAQNGPEYGMDFAIHETAHILWAYYSSNDIASRYPWMFEGLAYYLSAKLHNTASTFCIAQQSGAGMGGKSVGAPPGWKTLILQCIKDGTDPDARTVMLAQQNSMNSGFAVKAWSILDWLFTAKKKEFLKFIADLKALKTQEEALQDAFGGSYQQMQSDWAAWVKANY